MEPTNNSKQLQIPTASVSVSMPAPTLVAKAGPQAQRRFFEFFTANIRAHTRRAYAHAVGRFLARCEEKELEVTQPNQA